MMARPYHPPSLTALIADEDGSTAARLAAEERIRAIALETGRRRGLEEGLARGRADGLDRLSARAQHDLTLAFTLDIDDLLDPDGAVRPVGDVDEELRTERW